MIQDDVKIQSTAIAVWVATALLHRENKEKEDFQIKDIFQKVKDEKLISTADSTIMSHITVHCVANTKPWPNKHRKLYRTLPGWYRLYKDGDDYHTSREGGWTIPSSSEVPAKYRHLIEWYNTEYNAGAKPKPKSTGLTVTQVEEDGKAKIPTNILEKLDLDPKQDDYLAFVENASGEIILKKARLQVE